MQRYLPEPTAATEPYWAAARRGELTLQRCRHCRLFIHFPEDECPGCGRDDLAWERVSGRGAVHAFTVIHRTFVPGFEERTPYVVAWIELEEQAGLRVLGNVLGVDPAGVHVGLPVEVIFEELDGFGPIPNFRACESARLEED